MKFFKRLLCCCCLPRRKSRKAREKHVRTPDENHQQAGLEERRATVEHDGEERSTQPFNSQDLQVTSAPEMPTAQIQNDGNETASWNQHHLEEAAAKIQPDLEKLQHNIQDVIRITADNLQQSLRELYSKVEGELDEMDRKIQSSPPGRLETILLNSLHRENGNILDCLAGLVTHIQHDLDQTAAKIQSNLDNVAASVQCDPKKTAALCQHDQEILGMNIQHDLKVPTDKCQQDVSGATEHVTELQFSRTELTQHNLDEDGRSRFQLKTIGGNSEFSRGEKTEDVEKKVLECGSEREEQAAVGQSELKSEPTAPSCEEQEKTGSDSISVESFVFHKVLGRGGFGKVMLAEMKASGEYYAIKTMAKARLLEEDTVDYLRTEKRVLMLATESPFLSRLHCAFQTKDNLFLVMEYINGGNLFYHLEQRGRFDLATVRFFAAEIICGLQFLHRNGVIYRDLKLENVMLDRDGHIKIVDFGLSKDNMLGNSSTQTFCGTPLYIAPEIYEEKQYSTPVDWWAFGVLLFQLLTGETPFDGEDEVEIREAVCWTCPEYPPWVNRCTKDLLGKLLEKDPDRRLGTSGNIRAHPFFKPINWAKTERREVKPPFKPKLTSPNDCSNFEEEFLSETPRLSQDGSAGGPINQSAFSVDVPCLSCEQDGINNSSRKSEEVSARLKADPDGRPRYRQYRSVFDQMRVGSYA